MILVLGKVKNENQKLTYYFHQKQHEIEVEKTK